MSYCINCTYYDAYHYTAGLHPLCRHPKATITRTDPVGGKTRTFQGECRTMRYEGQPCGEEAALFEPGVNAAPAAPLLTED